MAEQPHRRAAGQLLVLATGACQGRGCRTRQRDLLHLPSCRPSATTLPWLPCVCQPPVSASMPLSCKELLAGLCFKDVQCRGMQETCSGWALAISIGCPFFITRALQFHASSCRCLIGYHVTTCSFALGVQQLSCPLCFPLASQTSAATNSQTSHNYAQATSTPPTANGSTFDLYHPLCSSQP